MPSTLRATTAYAAHTVTLLSLLTASAMGHSWAEDPHAIHVNRLEKRAPPGFIGCFSSSGSLDSLGSYTYQASGYCLEQCAGQAITALTGGDTCLCGAEAPSLADKVDTAKCSTNCNGYPQEKCGGDGFYTVYATDGDASGAQYEGGGSSASSPSSTAGPTTRAPATTGRATVVSSTVAGGSTVVVTQFATSDPESTSASSGGGGGGGSNTTGIAAGVVVGVVALAGLIAGLVFFIRRKKQKEAEEEFRQKNQVPDFMRGASERKPPGTGYSGLSDQRLDPEAGARRNSVGSLADNQDYSRRILRVANPDSS